MVATPSWHFKWGSCFQGCMRTEHRRGNSIQWVTRWQIGSQTAPAAWDAQRVKRVWGDFHELCAQAAVSTLQPAYLATSIPGIGMFTGAVKTVAWARMGINTQTYHWGFTLVPEPTLPSYQSPRYPRTRAHITLVPEPMFPSYQSPRTTCDRGISLVPRPHENYGKGSGNASVCT